MEPRDFVQKRASSYDWSGGNAGYREIKPGTRSRCSMHPSPVHSWDNHWANNYVPGIEGKENLDSGDNYLWLEASGRGHFVGVTMSILQNQDGWWGEGHNMFFVDGEALPSINGTGSEDYFLGVWDFGDHPFAYDSFGAPVKGDEVDGSHSSVYRFHLDSPIPFA